MTESSLNFNNEIFDVLKCKADEIVFIRYATELDATETSATLNDIFEYCKDHNVDCLFLPKSDEQVDITLSQMDTESLRRLENLIHTHIQKKSPIILA